MFTPDESQYPGKSKREIKEERRKMEGGVKKGRKREREKEKEKEREREEDVLPAQHGTYETRRVN